MKVTVDIFSGRPNPTWIVPDDEAQAVLKEIALNPAMVTKPEDAARALGYRSTVIQLTNESSAKTYSLPDRFVIAARASAGESKGTETAQRLIEQMDRGTHLERRASLATDLKTTLLNALRQVSTSKALPLLTTSPALAPPTPCPREFNTFSPDFWNGPAHLATNNCYNYANDRRTDTFAQPGKASGHLYKSFACSDVSAAAASDGLHSAMNCLPETEIRRYLVALVIWPGVDYHWYRASAEAHWTHKPGHTPAIDHDNSGHPITDPRTCDRADYTQFCSFFLTGKSVKVI